MKLTMYKVVIVDDKQTDADALEKALHTYPNMIVSKKVGSLREAEKAVRKVHADLLFLDVELPDGMGYEWLEKLLPTVNWPMTSVFYTAHDKYMINAIHISAFDYLLKPFQQEDLDKVIVRFEQSRNEPDSLPQPNEAARSLRNETFFTVYMPKNDIRLLRLSEIGYFRFNKELRCWEVYLVSDEVIRLRTTLRTEQILAFSQNFVQTYQSCIVNLLYLAMVVHDKECKLYPPFDKVSIPISQKYKKELLNRFMQL